MTYLLSHHGTLLCRAGEPGQSGRLVHRPPLALAGAVPVRLTLAWERMRGDFDRLLQVKATPLRLALPDGALAGFTLEVEANRRSVLLSGEAGFVCAEPDGGVSVDRAHAAGWERFVPLPEEDLQRLLSLGQTDWIALGHSEVICGSAVGLGAGHSLRFGPHSFDLRQQLPLDLDSGRLRLTLLREGWRIQQMAVFRPLIYCTAMRNAQALDQLWLCLRSLLRFGRYEGHVHLLTDRTAPEVLAQVPGLAPERLSVQRLAETDRVGAVASRYSIVDWPDAFGFQPVVFVDSDTIFDRDILPMLAAVAAADQILAPVEPFSPRASADSAGAALLRADAVVPDATLGFNSGTLGIPNLALHADRLRLVRRIIVNRAEAFGRGHFTWVDQPVANYVAERVGGFDTQVLGRFVRYGYPDLSLGDRRGLVHFWPPRDGAAKLAAMRAYVAALEALEPA